MTVQYLTGEPIVLAHRGGAALNLENSPTAFAAAAALGVRHIETDARASADGVAHLIHDATIDRTCTGRGTIASLTANELAAIPMRNGDRLPTLATMLTQFPDLIWNVDVKCDDAGLAVLGAIAAADAWDRVALASFSTRRLLRLRALAGDRLSCATTPVEVARLRLGRPVGDGRPVAAQIPIRMRGVQVLTPGLITRAHEAGIAVQVWTINDRATMTELLGLGVDGLVTDHPDRALAVLSAR